MNKEIEFRGKDHNGNWHYGSLLKATNGDYYIGELILEKENQHDAFSKYSFRRGSGKTQAMYGGLGFVKVKPETVGQYIGLISKGDKIYHSDIIQYKTFKGIVKYDEPSYYLDILEDPDGLFDIVDNRFKYKYADGLIVYGTAHD